MWFCGEHGSAQVSSLSKATVIRGLRALIGVSSRLDSDRHASLGTMPELISDDSRATAE